MITETIQLYETRQDVTLTTYVIAEKGEMHTQGERPAVLICPGGGYFNCSDREAEPVALKFASMGYHAFVLRYSTYDEGKNQFPDLSAPISVNEKTKHPAPVRDIGKAMLLIRSHAKQWSVDMNRVAVCGFSAGAHNTAMYSVYWNTPLLTEHFHVEAELLRPAAAILCYTVSDYTFMKEIDKSPMDAAFFKASITAFLGEEDPSDERMEEVSPNLRVTDNTPPTFLWATAGDTLVPAQHSLRMAHALADKSIPYELHIFESGPHGLSLASQASALSKMQMNGDAAKWTELAEAWLKKRFSIKLPEKTPFEEMLE